MIKAIYLDMDGTIANLYGVPDWLHYLVDLEDTYPYDVAEPMQDMMLLDDLIRLLGDCGITVGVVSWGSKGSSPEYLDAVRAAKRKWLAKHLPSVREVHVVPYGEPKHRSARIKHDAVLFDDDLNVRGTWDDDEKGRLSFDPSTLVEFIAGIARIAVESR